MITLPSTCPSIASAICPQAHLHPPQAATRNAVAIYRTLLRLLRLQDDLSANARLEMVSTQTLKGTSSTSDSSLDIVRGVIVAQRIHWWGGGGGGAQGRRN